MLPAELDDDQLAILYVYSEYSSESEHIYLQYTAALVIFYYLMKKGIFPEYKDQLLVYDYKDTRRFLWEDKKFMADINVIRDVGYLNRARLKTTEYRDLNAHYCTKKGLDFIREEAANTDVAKKIDGLLTCKCGRKYEVNLKDDQPELRCKRCRRGKIKVDGFLKDLSKPISLNHKPAFI